MLIPIFLDDYGIILTYWVPKDTTTAGCSYLVEQEEVLHNATPSCALKVHDFFWKIMFSLSHILHTH
jgi:hypothetical protein